MTAAKAAPAPTVPANFPQDVCLLTPEALRIWARLYREMLDRRATETQTVTTQPAA